jgi:DNA-binding MarR family transcriptional regulator
MYIHIFNIKTIDTMGIQEEIKQNNFENEFHKLCRNILYTGSWINLENTSYLKEFSLSPQQFNVLRILKREYPKPVTVNLIQDRMIDKTSNASRLVEKLRLKGLVERKQCENNRRAVDILITQKGQDILAEINNQPAFENIFKSLSLEEALQLNILLNKLREGNSEKIL